MIIPTAKRNAYRAFGLRFSSDLALPELLSIDDEEGAPDVEIRIADLSGIWDDSLFHDSYYAGKDGDIYFHLPGIAHVCIRGGREILVSPLAGSDENQVRLYVLGSCMGALLMQRQILPLHGSAVVVDGKAYAFVGESGAGKSTLAAAFVRQGYPLVSDDVIAVSLSHEGTPVVTPSYPQQKLWQESLTGFGMETAQYAPLYGGVNKYAIPVRNRFYSSPVPLGGIFELLPARDDLYVHQLEGLEKLPVFRFHTYRSMLIPILQLEKWHFHMSASISTQVRVYQVRRSASSFAPEQLLARIVDSINKGA